MRVKLLEAMRIKGRQHKPGDRVEVPEAMVEAMVGLRMAEREAEPPDGVPDRLVFMRSSGCNGKSYRPGQVVDRRDLGRFAGLFHDWGIVADAGDPRNAVEARGGLGPVERRYHGTMS